MRKRRFEILLPLRHNDGRPIDGEAFEQTREELVARFGAVTLSPHTLLGVWVHEGARYEDELLRLIVDVDDTSDNLEFLSHFKQDLLRRFDQIEIYIASYTVEIL